MIPLFIPLQGRQVLGCQNSFLKPQMRRLFVEPCFQHSQHEWRMSSCTSRWSRNRRILFQGWGKAGFSKRKKHMRLFLRISSHYTQCHHCHLGPHLCSERTTRHRIPLTLRRGQQVVWNGTSSKIQGTPGSICQWHNQRLLFDPYAHTAKECQESVGKRGLYSILLSRVRFCTQQKLKFFLLCLPLVARFLFLDGGILYLHDLAFTSLQHHQCPNGLHFSWLASRRKWMG